MPLSDSQIRRRTITIPGARPGIRRIFKNLFFAALDACDPALAINRSFRLHNSRLRVQNFLYDLTRFNRVLCIGAGKASGRMTAALEHILGDRLEGGIVIVKDGYGVSTEKIQILEAGHPIPDHRGIRGTKQILTLIRTLTKKDLVIVMLSGGASSLLCAPSIGLTLKDKQRTTGMLLHSGATIQEMNTIRKHLSAIKGGQIARETAAALLTVIVSDVIGDDLTTVGSGPTVPDPSTFQDAIDILKHYKVLTKVPPAIKRHLQNGLAKKIPETLKPMAHGTSRNRHILLINNHTALDGIAKAARQFMLKPYVLPFPLQGEASEVGSVLGRLARDLVQYGNPLPPPACLIAGGEPTVTVRGKGKGGRAQECVLAAARELSGLRNIFVAGFGTDGTDGPTDAAGALVDGGTVERAFLTGIDVVRILKNHDSYNFFKKMGGHIISGPTYTNVNDIYLILAL